MIKGVKDKLTGLGNLLEPLKGLRKKLGHQGDYSKAERAVVDHRDDVTED